MAGLKGGYGPRRFLFTAAAVLLLAASGAAFLPDGRTATNGHTVQATHPDLRQAPVVASSISQDPQGATAASSWSMSPVYAPVPPALSEAASWLEFWFRLRTRLG